jgi:hypothetical protein
LGPFFYITLTSNPAPTAWRRAQNALHLSPEQLATTKSRNVPILGMRFDTDPTCPLARFDRLRTEFGAQFEAIEIPTRYAQHPLGTAF